MLLSNINCTPATKKREKEKKIKDEGRKEGRKEGREGGRNPPETGSCRFVRRVNSLG